MIVIGARTKSPANENKIGVKMENVLPAFESLPTPVQQRIEDKVSSIIARASIKGALLSRADIKTLTGYSEAQVTKILKDPAFPACYKVLEGSHPRWKSAEVFAYLSTKRDRKWLKC